MNPEERKRASQAAAGKAAGAVIEQIVGMEPGQVIPFMTTLLVLTTDLLRVSGERDAEVRELLAEAVKSLDRPPTFRMKDLRVN